MGLTCRLNGEPLSTEDVLIVTGLRAGISARLTPEHTIGAIERGTPCSFALSREGVDGPAFEVCLEVADFDLPEAGPGGWVHFNDGIVSTAKPIELELFGSSFAEAIRSRCEDAVVARQLDERARCAIAVSDLAYTELLDAISSRTGYPWWIDEGRLHVEPLDRDTVDLPIDELRRRTGRRVVRTRTWVPTGQRVRLRDGFCGSVLSSEIRQRKGSLVEIWLTIGEDEPPPAARARFCRRLRGRIDSPRDPFRVVVDSGRGDEVITEAELMVRQSDAASFLEELPLAEGTPVLVEIEVGGLSTSSPLVYVWSPGNSCDEYRFQTPRRRDQIDEWNQDVGRIWTLTKKWNIDGK